MLCLMARCLRYLLLVMCTHPFAKKGLTLHLAYSEGREPYFGCNLMHRKVLAPFHQHLMAEAPSISKGLSFGTGRGTRRSFRAGFVEFDQISPSKPYVGGTPLKRLTV